MRNFLKFFGREISRDIVAVVAVAGIAVFALAFTEPSVGPTGGTVSAPVNTGTIAQTKQSGLTINPGQLWASTVVGNTTITVNSGGSYCIGASCITAWPVSGGGTITGVTAGAGLTGGGVSGVVTLNAGAGTGVTVGADTIGLAYPTKSCGAGNAIQSFDVGSSASPGCVAVGGGGGTPGGVNGNVQFNNSGAFGGDSNLFWDNTGKNLGVGITIPWAKVDVGGLARYVAGLRTLSATNQNVFIVPEAGAGGYNPLSQSSDSGIFFSDNFGANSGGGLVIGPWKSIAQGLRINAEGRVGIGLSYPQERLDVGGNIYIGGNYLKAGDLGIVNSAMRFWSTEGGVIAGFSDGTSVTMGKSSGGNKGVGFGATGGGAAKFALYYDPILNFTSLDTFSNNLLLIPYGGKVGIGTLAPSDTLTVNGTAWVTSGSWSGSDIRWKKNIKPLENSLSKALSLQGVNFEWKKEEYPDISFKDGTQIGFIAQDIEKILPEVVTADNNGYKGISYEKLVPILTEAIKEQQKEIESLKARIDALEQK